MVTIYHTTVRSQATPDCLSFSIIIENAEEVCCQDPILAVCSRAKCLGDQSKELPTQNKLRGYRLFNLGGINRIFPNVNIQGTGTCKGFDYKIKRLPVWVRLIKVDNL